MYLDFARRTRQCGPRHQPRSREIPRLAACTVTEVYRFTLPSLHRTLSFKDENPVDIKNFATFVRLLLKNEKVHAIEITKDVFEVF